jgi:hypothetical protein
MRIDVTIAESDGNSDLHDILALQRENLRGRVDDLAVEPALVARSCLGRLRRDPPFS